MDQEYSRDELLGILRELIPEGERERFGILANTDTIVPLVSKLDNDTDYGYEPSDADESATIL